MDKHLARLLKLIPVALLTAVTLMPMNSYADHEQWIVGQMRDVDPSAKGIISVSGTCVPSHDRERLDCYLTVFSIARDKSDETLRKESEEIQQELKKDPVKSIQDGKKAFCTGDMDMSKPPKPLLHSAELTNASFLSMRAFCENPSQQSLLALFQVMIEVEAKAKTCRCTVAETRHTFLRRGDRWIETEGPSGLCDVITITTLIPNDPKKMDTQSGPGVWPFTQKMVATHPPDKQLCTPPDKKNPFNVYTAPIEGTMTLKWDAPRKSLDCSEFEFTSILEGMSHPRKE